MRFDALVEEVLEELPSALRDLLEEVALVVEDVPGPELLRGVEGGPIEDPTELCGLHSGRAFTEESVEHSGEPPSTIYLFREGIVAMAGGWGSGPQGPMTPGVVGDAAEAGPTADDLVYEEIWVTLLHEIGHQFGLSEEDLERLGYE
jgi:predicted Zn-dependent protease with MMP-like domain